MTKEIYPAPGRIKITCRVVSIKNRRKYVSQETGTNSMSNVARDYKSKIQNAKLNAIYRHMSKGGGSDATVEVIDFDIVYFTKKVMLHKETKVGKDGKKKRYAYATDRVTGKRVQKARIIRKGEMEEFE